MPAGGGVRLCGLPEAGLGCGVSRAQGSAWQLEHHLTAGALRGGRWSWQQTPEEQRAPGVWYQGLKVHVQRRRGSRRGSSSNTLSRPSAHARPISCSGGQQGARVGAHLWDAGRVRDCYYAAFGTAESRLWSSRTGQYFVVLLSNSWEIQEPQPVSRFFAAISGIPAPAQLRAPTALTGPDPPAPVPPTPCPWPRTPFQLRGSTIKPARSNFAKTFFLFF